MNELHEIAGLATQLATDAGNIVRAGEARTRHEVLTKSSGTDVVTEVDKASESYIVAALRARRPADGIIGEEGTTIEGSSGVNWVIDPLDGTVNFLYGIPAYAISIGVVVDGEPVVGAVYNPSLDELYTATLGQGAFCNGLALQVNAVTELSQALVATGFSYGTESRARQGEVVARLLPHIRDIRRLGAAAIDLCHLASGRVDAYYEVGIHPWDVIAGIVIAGEAGAKVTAFDGTIPDHNIVAAVPAIYEDLMGLVNQPGDITTTR